MCERGAPDVERCLRERICMAMRVLGVCAEFYAYRTLYTELI